MKKYQIKYTEENDEKKSYKDLVQVKNTFRSIQNRALNEKLPSLQFPLYKMCQKLL